MTGKEKGLGHTKKPEGPETVRQEAKRAGGGEESRSLQENLGKRRFLAS